MRTGYIESWICHALDHIIFVQMKALISGAIKKVGSYLLSHQQRVKLMEMRFD